MIAPCRAPIAFETHVAYWARDLTSDEGALVEEHVMGCTPCTSASAAVAAIGVAVRALIPPIVSPEAVRGLLARGVRIVDNPIAPGARKQSVFAASTDVLLHRLGGLDLSRATRVGVTIHIEETGLVIFQNEDAPFDREGGEVLVACQRHFRSYPPNIVFDVRAVDGSGRETLAVYTVAHIYT